LCPFGFLALGAKESLHFASKRKQFEDISGKERIFMKVS
jgi:hypothetical protein